MEEKRETSVHPPPTGAPATGNSDAYDDLARLVAAHPEYRFDVELFGTEKFLEQMERARAYLTGQFKLLKPRKIGYTAYRLKHIAERDQKGYISEGAFIAVALQLGIRVRPSPMGYHGQVYF